jgi:isopenicillin N synthase-like dioxygenase
MDPRDQPPDVLKDGMGMPPFPDNLPIAEIPYISYKKMLDGNVPEIAQLLSSVRTLGFFRIDLRDSGMGQELLKSANNMFQLSAKTFALPFRTKMADSMLKHKNVLAG